MKIPRSFSLFSEPRPSTTLHRV